MSAPPPYGDLGYSIEQAFKQFFTPLTAGGKGLYRVALQTGITAAKINAPCLIMAAHDQGKAFGGVTQYRRVKLLFELQTFITDTPGVHHARAATIDDALFGFSPTTRVIRRPSLKDLSAELQPFCPTVLIKGITVNPSPENKTTDDKWIWGRIITVIARWYNPI